MREHIYQLLLIDDDPLVHQSLKLILPSHWRCISVQNFEDVNYTHPYSVAFVDLHLKKDSKEPLGLTVIKKLCERNPHLIVYAISGDLDLPLMEKTLEVGAQRFLAKPLQKEEVLNQLLKLESLIQIRKMSQAEFPEGFIGKSHKAEEIRQQISQLRGEAGPILIEGESGTGKEVVAHLLHQQEDGLGPLISVNMAGIPDNLFESELFGHLKGAFTGADQNKVGMIEAAAGGTLFLDEIEAIPLNQQAKLLRFLENGEIKKLGAKETQIIQCRVFAATNRNLLEMVKNKEFREDLYFRLSGKKILLPALRSRAEDIAELSQVFLKRLSRSKSFSPEALSSLEKNNWQGNVRELKRVCEQLVFCSRLPVIRPQDIEQILFGGAPRASNLATGDFDLSLGFNHLVSRFEKELIEFSLTKFSDVDKTAEGLGISRSTLYKKIKDYQIDSKGNS